MNIDFEMPMAALFDHLVAAASVPITADVTAGSAVLTNASFGPALFVGLPVFGPGMPAGALVKAIDPGANTVTLTDPATATAAAAALTTGFLTTGRRVEHWSSVANQPALFLRRTGVTDEHDQHFSITTLDCEAWIYCNAGQDPTVAPDHVLTGLERLVRASFAPDTDYGDPRFTLNRTVHWCRIEGRSDISPGDQGGQAIARIPIRITLP